MSDVTVLTGRTGSHWVDDGREVRRAASDLVSGLLGVQVTATSVRARWLGLRSAYDAPEAEVVWAAMDGPSADAHATLSLGREVQDVLWAYADRLDALNATWVEPEDTATFQATVEAADRDCADAIGLIVRPFARPAASGPWGPPTPVLWVGAPPVCGPTWGAPPIPRWDPLNAWFQEWGGFGPPLDRGETSRALYSLGLSHAVGSGYVTWVYEIDFVSRTPPLVDDLTAAGKWSKAGTALDRVGVGLTFAQSGWKEWKASETTSTGERVGRSVTMGATTASGAWAGAEAGAITGSLIGSAFGPGPGTAVGMIIGGTVGGFAGSYAGEYVGAHLVDYGGKVGDLAGDGLEWVGDEAGDAVHWAAEGAGNAYDTLAFWDEA